jgi:hypothetical protein
MFGDIVAAREVISVGFLSVRLFGSSVLLVYAVRPILDSLVGGNCDAQPAYKTYTFTISAITPRSARSAATAAINFFKM